jgi:hypothetical protein
LDERTGSPLRDAVVISDEETHDKTEAERAALRNFDFVKAGGLECTPGALSYSTVLEITGQMCPANCQLAETSEGEREGESTRKRDHWAKVRATETARKGAHAGDGEKGQKSTENHWLTTSYALYARYVDASDKGSISVFFFSSPFSFLGLLSGKSIFA